MIKKLLTLLTTLSLSPILAGEIPIGIIEGEIIDAYTGKALPAATISIVGTARGSIADIEGRFTINDIPAGTYSIRVTLIGYNEKVLSDIVIGPARPAMLIIELNQTTINLNKSTFVTSAFFNKTNESYTSSQSLSNEEIRRLPGSFEDVIRTTASLPGVAQVQAGRNDLIVRGGAPTENLYVIDDIEVNNINHFGTQGSSGGPLSYVNLDFVDNIKFYTGGFGVKYGNRLSSALNIQLRDGRSDRLGGKATISGSLFGLDLEGPMGEQGNIIFSARRSYLDLIFRAAGFEFVPEYWDFLLKTNYRLDSKNQISLFGITALDDVKFFNADTEDIYENSRRLKSKLQQAVSGFKWRHLVPNGKIILSVGQTYVNFDYSQNDTLMNPYFISDSYEYESFLRLESQYLISQKTNLAIGIVSKYLKSSGEIFLDSFDNTFGENFTIENKYKMQANNSAGYLQFSQELWAASVIAGMRFDYFDVIKNKWAVSSRIATSIRLTPRLSLNSSIGIYKQSPSLVWLSSNSYNRNLKFANADQYIFGVEFLAREDTRIGLETYYKKYSDLPASLQQDFLVMSNIGAGFGGAEENFSSFGIDSLISEGKGRSYGIELSVQKKLSEIPCYGIISLSLNKSEYAGLDGIYRPGSYHQSFIGVFSGGYIFNRFWEFSARFRFETGRPYTPFNADGYQDPTLYNSLRISTNHSLDVRVDKRWFLSGWTLIAYLDVQNVYSRESDGVPRYNARKGEIESVNSLGIFPILGVSAEF
jgi:hypothetical protein